MRSDNTARDRPLAENDLVQGARRPKRTAEEVQQWWRNAGHLISVAALGVSIVLGIYTLWRDVLSNEDAIRERLRETINDIAALDLAWAQVPLDKLWPEMRQAVSYSINNRRVLLLVSAEGDVKALDGKVPPEFLAIMGASYVAINNSDGALDAFRKLLEAFPNNSYMRAVALRNLANVYLGMGKEHHDDALARLKEAVQALENEPSLMAQLIRATYTVELAQALTWTGSPQEGEAWLEQVIPVLDALPCFPSKRLWLAEHPQLATRIGVSCT